jgi:hypothetical protein
MKNRPVGGRRSETYSHPIIINQVWYGNNNGINISMKTIIITQIIILLCGSAVFERTLAPSDTGGLLIYLDTCITPLDK